MTTRRFFLGGVAWSGLLAYLAPPAVAANWGRFSDTPRRLTSIRVANIGKSDAPAYSVTQLVGCPFRKGDIPAGQWPQFQLDDGTSVACTLLSSLATTWSDGSLKFVPAMLQIPVPIESHKRVSVSVLSGGGLSQVAPRSLTDFQSGIAPQVQVDGLDNLSGTWVMDLTDGISHGTKIVTYGNGPAGGVWKVRARAQHDGTHYHPQLVCDFYVASLANGDGSLKGMRILGKVKLPYYDSKRTMNWMSFSRFQLCSDSQGSLIRDCFGKNFGARRSYQFSWVSGSTFDAHHRYSLNEYGYCTRLSSTGSLPSGLSPNTSYFTGGLTDSTVGFGTNSAVPGWTLVSATDSGTGVHTATPYPYLSYFGALFTANSAGLWDFVQGAGTDSADTPLRCEIDKKYWVSTGLVPPYDVKLKVAANSHASYWPNCSGPVTRYLGQTGERPDIGLLPSWYARHFLTQSAVDEQVVRVTSLIGGQFSVGLEHSGSLSYPCVNNGPSGDGKGYKGMPAPNSAFRWHPSLPTQGFTDTTNPNVLMAGFSGQDTSHMPQFNYYPYLFTGEPWHLDMLLEHANSAVYSRYNSFGSADINEDAYSLGTGERNLQVSTNATYGDTIGSHETRADAWASALVAAAAGICPNLDPDCRSYKAYFGDLNAATWRAAVNIYKALPRYAKGNGLWHVPPDAGWEIMDHWQMAYLGAATSLAVAATENRNASIALSSLVRWFDHVVAQFGGWHAGTYETLIKSSDSGMAPLVTSDSGVAFYGPALNWKAGKHFTVLPFSNYTPANGDVFIFTDVQPTPAGFAQYTPYYMVKLNGSDFGLAAHPAGVAIPITDSYSGSDPFFFVSSQPPQTGSITPIGFPTAYNTEVLGMLNYAIAVGTKVNVATIADLAYRDQQAGLDFSSDPKWAFVSTMRQ